MHPTRISLSSPRTCKKSRHFRRIVDATLLTSLALVLITAANAYEWKASITPASLYKDNSTIRLVANATNVLVFYLQADQEVLNRSKKHSINLSFRMPRGIRIVSTSGYYEFHKLDEAAPDAGETLDRYEVKVENRVMTEKIHSRLDSSWQNQSIFVEVAAADLDEAGHFLEITIADGEYQKTFRWPVEVLSVSPPQQRPKLTKIGLWDYNFSRATDPEASEGVARLFHQSGINFTQIARDDGYRRAMRDVGIEIGGETHHAFFYRSDCANYQADGKKITSDYCDPTSILSLPAEDQIPGVRKLVEQAIAGDGIATFDYEPRGNTGFSPQAIKLFREKYGVTESDFERFQCHVTQENLHTFRSADPVISRIWRHWVSFQTTQMSRYVERIYRSFKNEYPEGRLAVTPSSSFGDDSPKTLAWGINSAAMSPYCDIIMPQAYSGYDAKATKQVMQIIEGWRQEMTMRNARSALWPILLIRYAGASVANAPIRIRQQMIGSMAHGATGVLFYYPGMMDAPYWETVARTTEEIAKYEKYYHQGQRVDDQFPLNGMPRDETTIHVYPGVDIPVKNSKWAFTAHRLKQQVLLTLINLQDDEILCFDIEARGAKFVSAEGAQISEGTHPDRSYYTVPPNQIGFVILEQ